MPMTILVEVKEGFWTWNFWSCLVYVYSDVFLCSASIVHMTMISLDRYIGISNPLRMHNKSSWIVIFKISLVWIISLIISSPLAIIALYDGENIFHHESCAIRNRYFMFFGSTLAYLIPFLIMFGTYVKTTQILNRQASLIRKTSSNPSVGGGLRRTIPRQASRTNSYNTLNVPRLHKSTSISYSSTDLTENSIIFRTPSYANFNSSPPKNPYRKTTVQGQTFKLDRNLNPLSLERRSSSCLNLSDLPSQKNSLMVPSDPPTNLEKWPKPSTQNLHRSKSPSMMTLNLPDRSLSNTFPTVIKRLVHGNSVLSERTQLCNEQKATRVLALVFMCFFICWTPFFALNFTNSICGSSCEIPKWFFPVFQWLGYVSSTINPIIYTIFNRRFRQAFIRILKCNRIAKFPKIALGYPRSSYVYDRNISTYFDNSMIITTQNGKHIHNQLFMLNNDAQIVDLLIRVPQISRTQSQKHKSSWIKMFRRQRSTDSDTSKFPNLHELMMKRFQDGCVIFPNSYVPSLSLQRRNSCPQEFISCKEKCHPKFQLSIDSEQAYDEINDENTIYENPMQMSLYDNMRQSVYEKLYS